MITPPTPIRQCLAAHGNIRGPITKCVILGLKVHLSIYKLVNFSLIDFFSYFCFAQEMSFTQVYFENEKNYLKRTTLFRDNAPFVINLFVQTSRKQQIIKKITLNFCHSPSLNFHFLKASLQGSGIRHHSSQSGHQHQGGRN